MQARILITRALAATAIALSACAKPAEEARTAEKPEGAQAGAPEAAREPGEGSEAAERKEKGEGAESEAPGEQAEKREAGEAGEAGEGREGHETTVKLEGEALEHAGVKTALVDRRPVTATIATTGEVVANPDREARVTPRIAGRVLRALKTVGDRVRAGEALAVLESVELGQAESEYLEAQARHRLVKRQLERQRQLFRKDLAAAKEVQAAENDFEVAQITLEKAANKLTLFGLTPGRLATLAATRRLDPTLPLLAPIGGVVTAKNVTIGEVLQPEAAEPAFRLTDTAVLWVSASVYEKDLGRVHEGQAATVTSGAYGGQSFEGRVARIATALDPATRTAKARVVVANPQGRLKPEMFVNVRFHVGTQQALAIPVAAVLQEKGERFAFVEEAPGVFERRPLELGERAGGYFPVSRGVAAGEKVVVAGGFTLKSELLKESFGDED